MKINFSEKQTGETIANYLIPHHVATAAVLYSALLDVPFYEYLPGKTLFIVTEIDDDHLPEGCEAPYCVMDVLLVGYDDKTGVPTMITRSGKVINPDNLVFTCADEAMDMCDLITIRKELTDYKRDCFKDIHRADKLIKHIDNVLGIES